MKTYLLILKLSSCVFFVVAALHLCLGPGADVLLGAALSAESIKDPVLDSQNRFYGVSFAVYGVLLALASTEIDRYSVMLRCVLWTFFAGGLARLVSIAAAGLPSALVIALATIELLLPPVLIYWLARLQATRTGVATDSESRS